MVPLLYVIETSPPCRAVFMLARAIGLKLNIKYINMTEGEHLGPEYLKVS